jgi:enoyl-CoA hydratase
MSDLGGAVIERDVIDGIAVVRLAHGKVNALDRELAEAITATFTELADSPHPAVVLTGSGRAFSAGVDLRRMVREGPGYAQPFLSRLDQAFESIFNLPKPVVAAVNGHAIAGGCVLASACDRRLMTDIDARIGIPELYAGVPFPSAALEIMRFAVGDARLADLVLTGATLPPQDALHAGLVDEVTAPRNLLAQALRVATDLAAGIPSPTFQLTKRQLRDPVNQRLQHARQRDETDVVALWAAAETTDWISAYMDRITRHERSTNP